MERAIEHMNEDHADSLLDYAMYYGGAPYSARNAQLLPESTKDMLIISYEVGGSKSQTTVPVTPQPAEQSNLRESLVAMSRQASAARIPPFEISEPNLSLGLFFLLVVLGCASTVNRNELAQWPMPELWGAAVRACETTFGSIGTAKKVFLSACIAHLSEGLFTFVKLSFLVRKGGRGWGRVLMWTLQTALFGFPSLQLLLGKLNSRTPKEE